MGFHELSRREFGGLLTAVVGGAVLGPGLTETNGASKYPAPDTSFFSDCAFVCIDIQEEQRTKVTSISKEWEASGYTVADCQAAVDFCYDVAMPNARKVADGCRGLELPMVFVHWGCLFKDGMDLEPRVRRAFVAGEGDNPAKWTPLAATTRPAAILGVREGEYVFPKTAQDAFTSCNIGFLVENLGIKNIVFVGGHTNPGGCLGQTGRSAHKRGYKILCVEDATFDAGESTRKKGIESVPFDYVVSTEQFLKLTERAKAKQRARAT
ncbi:MAG TPA: isochorismatase family protein [Candidatus Bathyarchaeia archaeon]|nr:isochorismatase family protein [Candidatus Bathyarchaeia archaeon]